MAGLSEIARTGYLFASVTLALAACGDSKPSGGYNRPERPAYTERQIVTALGLHRVGQSWEDGKQECVASVILLSRGQIATYADAGDPVATNPPGTVGVKVGTYQGVDPQMCFDRFQAALKRLR